jgi:hypothetical protein
MVASTKVSVRRRNMFQLSTLRVLENVILYPVARIL